MAPARNIGPGRTYLSSPPTLRRRAGFALVFAAVGLFAGAGGIAVRFADRGVDWNGSAFDRDALALHAINAAPDSASPVPVSPDQAPPSASTASAASDKVSEPPDSSQASAIHHLTAPAGVVAASTETTPPPVPGAAFSDGIASSASPATAALGSRQDSAASSAQADPTEATVSAATEPSVATVGISKKPRKKARSHNRSRQRGWYDAYAWRPRAWYGRGRSYGYGYWRAGW